jgi:hypothetical protein
MPPQGMVGADHLRLPGDVFVHAHASLTTVDLGLSQQPAARSEPPAPGSFLFLVPLSF